MESEGLASSAVAVQSPPSEDKYDNFYTPGNRDFYSKHIYEKLDTTQPRIRLLRMTPLPSGCDNNSTPLNFELLQNVLIADVKGKYTTLSYCAGDPKATKEVIVNGAVFNVFGNLHHALGQVRRYWRENRQEEELLLWADQICIDQSNLTERADQVGMMGDIYSSAEQVLICLSVQGDVSGGLSWLCDLSRDFWTFADAEDDHHVQIKALGDVGSPRENEDEHNLPTRGMRGLLYYNWHDKDFHNGWHAFVKTILKSHWWSRAWIRQEFILSPNAVFLAAEESASWTEIVTATEHYYLAAMYFGDYRPRLQERLCGGLNPCQACVLGKDPRLIFDEVRKMRLLFAAKKTGARQDLLFVLHDAKLCEATDSRDLIYAFFGLSLHSYGVCAEYSQDTKLVDVLLQLACNVISYNQNLDVLLFALRCQNREEDVDLPSWVPDWRYVSDCDLGYHKIFLGSTTFTHQVACLKPDREGRESRVLRARGRLVHVLSSQSLDFPLEFVSTVGDTIPVAGLGEVGAEVWMLYGATNLLLFRRVGQYH
jgi:hypothetical protein